MDRRVAEAQVSPRSGLWSRPFSGIPVELFAFETDPLALDEVEEEDQLGAVFDMNHGDRIDVLFNVALWRRAARQVQDKREHFPAPAAPS